MKAFAITGTFSGSIVFAKTEGDARRAFHKKYNGESIIHVRKFTSLEMARLIEEL